MEDTLVYEKWRRDFLDACFRNYMEGASLDESVNKAIAETRIVDELPPESIMKGVRTEKGFSPYPVLKKTSTPMEALEELLRHALKSDTKSAFSNHPVKKALVVNRVLPNIFEEKGEVSLVYSELYSSFDSDENGVSGGLKSDEGYFRLTPSQITGNEMVSPFSDVLVVNRVYDWLDKEHSDKL